MAEYVIERGIPIPPHGNTRDDSMLGRVRQLEVGESLWADSFIESVSAAGRNARKKFPDRRFVVRREGTGARIWRTA